jgi:hypothetical protein
MVVALIQKKVAEKIRMDARMRLWVTACLLSGVSLIATAAVPVDEIEKQLLELYQTSKATADNSDLVTAGSVLVLQKDHLLMDPVDTLVPTPNVYKNGSIKGLAGAATVLKTFGSMSSHLGALNPFANNAAVTTATDGANATREFVAGEKFWVTKIDTGPDGVKFSLLSDPIKDKRYHATLLFPFPKDSSPTADDVAGLVAEVVKIDAGDNSPAQQPASNQNPQQSAPTAPAPKTVALGQSRDQVIATLGVPAKIVQLGPKEIDVYPDMKITFLQNRVVDVN